MKKEVLVQYCDVREEIKDLNDRIEKLNKTNNMAVDSVKGSSAEFPYTEFNMTIQGIDITKSNRITKYKKMLKNKYDELLELQLKVEGFIESIKDSRIRQIFRYKYLDNKTWTQIAHKFRGTADGLRMEHNRFFNNK